MLIDIDSFLKITKDPKLLIEIHMAHSARFLPCTIIPFTLWPRGERVQTENFWLTPKERDADCRKCYWIAIDGLADQIFEFPVNIHKSQIRAKDLSKEDVQFQLNAEFFITTSLSVISTHLGIPRNKIKKEARRERLDLLVKNQVKKLKKEMARINEAINENFSGLSQRPELNFFQLRVKQLSIRNELPTISRVVLLNLKRWQKLEKSTFFPSTYCKENYSFYVKFNEKRDNDIFVLTSKILEKGSGKKILAALNWNTGRPLVWIEPHESANAIQSWEREIDFFQTKNFRKGVVAAQLIFKRDETKVNDSKMIIIQNRYMGDLLEFMNNTTKLPHTPEGKKELLKLMLDVAEAIEALHRENIAHRDIKPENILVQIGKSGRLKGVLTDFGFCQKIGKEREDRRSSCGSYGYLPLDVMLLEEGSEATAQSLLAADCWAFAIVLLIMSRRKMPVITQLQDRCFRVRGEKYFQEGRLEALKKELISAEEAEHGKNCELTKIKNEIQDVSDKIEAFKKKEGEALNEMLKESERINALSPKEKEVSSMTLFDVICSILKEDPLKRMKMEDVVLALKSICESGDDLRAFDDPSLLQYFL